MGEMRNAYRILIGKSEGRKSIDRPRHGTDKMELKEIRCEDVYWIHLAQETQQQRDFIDLRVP
jgi:hypothetical protein